MTSNIGIVLVGVYTGITAVLLAVTNSVQPAPYMDEIFHIPQAQKYCYGKFKEWDEKITTLPGLYVVSVGVLNPISSWLQQIFCDPIHLRSINVLMSSLTLLILQRITTQIHGSKHFYDENKCLLSAFNLALFPLLYFFNFLYYTDVGSTFMVLLMYCLHLDRRDWFAAFIGVLSVLFRQTNIIWVAFVAVQSLGPYFLHTIHTSQMEQMENAKFSLTTRGQAVEVFEGLYRLVFLQPKKGLGLLPLVFKVAGGYVLVGVAFVAFVILNDGIVVGDRSAHTATFHPMQICYFVAFSLGLSAPFCFSKVKLNNFANFCQKHWIFTGMCALAVAFCIDSYTIAHPYLLADNRHYTFYIWRRIIVRTSYSKYAILPVYVYAGYCVLHALRHNSIIFKLSFPIFACLNLMPQALLEFRYFVIPYILYRLQVRPTSWHKLLLESGLYMAINAFTIALFICKPFEWPHEPGQIQRIIW